MSAIRTRWAAVGAAVAISLGAGGIGLATAEIGSGPKPVTVLLDAPCRLLETRPNQQGSVAVPSRDTPLGEGEAYTVSATAAPLGNCDLTPATLGATIVGLVTNVTPVLPTTATDLRLYPTGSAVPRTSNLNPAPGQPPTPNAVTVGVNGSGQFDILNKFGEVHVIIDVVGYLAGHHHDDRYYTQSDVDTLIATTPGPIAGYEIVEGPRTTVLGTFTFTAEADCPAGKVVLGGGGAKLGDEAPLDVSEWEIRESRPKPDGSGWQIELRPTNTVAQGAGKAYAVCATGSAPPATTTTTTMP